MVSIGAALCPVLGYVSDAYGLNYAFIIMTIVCAIALACSMLLPNVEENEEKWCNQNVHILYQIEKNHQKILMNFLNK
ncbi:MAG: hypothetical protein ACLR43_12230 [Faecalibacillus faecis]